MSLKRRTFITLLGGASRCALGSRRGRLVVGFVSNRSPKRGYFKAEKLSREGLVHFGGSTAIASTLNKAPGRASCGTPTVVLAGGAAVFTYLSRTSR